MNHPRRALLLSLLALTTACVDQPETVGETRSALTPVTWTDVVGVSASGNDLTKTAPETIFNAGAVSVESLAGDGFVEFTTGEATADKACGLANGNGDQRLGDIDYAIRLNASGRVSIVEGGTTRASVGIYAAGDVFRVQTLGEVVTYYRNGVLLYTSELAPGFPLMVDTSLRTPGATIENVVIDSLLFWGDVVGAEAIGGDLTKTAPEDLFNAGAASVASIPAGDGYVEFGVPDATSARVAGLSNGNGGQSRGDIDFALYLDATGAVSVYEGGSKIRNAGSYAAGDRFQIEVAGGVVTYYRNHVALHTSAAIPVFPLLLDTSLKTPGTRIVDARVVPGSPLPDCAPLEQSILGGAGERIGSYLTAAGDVLVTRRVGGMRVYRRGGAGWAFEQDLPDTPNSSTSTDGTTIAAVVGAGDDVQVFRFDGAQWVDDGLLVGCAGDKFRSVAVAGDLLLAGEAAFSYVYRRGASGWVLDGVLRAEGGTSDSSFGIQSAIGGDIAFVGADSDSTAAQYAGAIYVFRYNAGLPDPTAPVSCDNRIRGKWRQRAVLTASNAAFGDSFPWSMDASADGTRLLAGSQFADTAHVFELAGTSWSETALLRPYPAANRFGWAVAFGGPGDAVAVVGSNRSFSSGVPGRAYVFADRGDVWTQIDYLSGGDGFGEEVAATADAVLVGDPLDDTGGESAGAVRVHGIEPVCVAVEP